MHHRLPLPLLSLLLVITLIHIPKSLCQDEQYQTCEQVYRCGGAEFRYPFWSGANRPDYCGYPGFEVSCRDNITPTITVSFITYRVLGSPDTGERTVQLARDDLASDSCAGNDGDDTVFSPTMFSYSDTQNLTLLYTCPTLPTPLPQNLNEFPCTENGDPTNYFILTKAFQSLSNPPNLSSCRHNITVPVSRDFRAVVGNGVLAGALMRGVPLGYKADNDKCDRCTRSNGQCGYNTDSKSFVCYCRDGQDCIDSTTNEFGTKKRLRVGLSAGVAALVMISILICCLVKRYSCCEDIISWRSDEASNQIVEEFMRNYGSIAPRLYTYAEIRKMTNSFAYKLGHGGYGCVYRGSLSDGREVAVKVLNDSKGGGEDFTNEVAAISRTSHVNVVALLGFCCNRRKRALIYEFMPNGSLDKFISWKEPTHLEWKLLYQIALGIARGLEYLHRGCNTRIVHLDIKPQNILLDVDFRPKISDFGLAKLCKSKESVLSTMGARGTVEYIAPEMVFPSFGGVSHKSDVYSFGMMVLEMAGLTRKPETDSQQTSEKYFPNWIHERVELGKEFPLKGVANEEEKEGVMKMIYVGLWCIQPNPMERPSTSKVVEMLEGSLQSLQVPPKPHFPSHDAAINFDQKSWTTSSIS